MEVPLAGPTPGPACEMWPHHHFTLKAPGAPGVEEEGASPLTLSVWQHKGHTYLHELPGQSCSRGVGEAECKKMAAESAGTWQTCERGWPHEGSDKTPWWRRLSAGPRREPQGRTDGGGARVPCSLRGRHGDEGLPLPVGRRPGTGRWDQPWGHAVPKGQGGLCVPEALPSAVIRGPRMLE